MASATETALVLRPLSPALGVEVMGLDLGKPLAPETEEALRAAWIDHLLLLFRGQSLAEHQQVAVARIFGEPLAPTNRRPGQTHPSVMLITNIRENGRPIGSLPDGELQFHSDSAFAERPLKATVLYGVEIPSEGGNTLFANMYRAYETLPDDLRTGLDGARAVNVFDYDTMVKTGRADRTTAPHATHPVFRRHPETGRRALYVNRLMTEEIVGLPAAESDALLAALFDHAEKRDFVYEHVWRPGDLLVWDNRCTQHARTDFPASQTRLMRRVAVAGDEPVG